MHAYRDRRTEAQTMLAIFNKLKSKAEWFFGLDKPTYHVEDINSTTQEVVLLMHGSSPVIRMQLMDVISSPPILGGLRADQACWIGYSYGLVLAKEATMNTRKSRSTQSQLGFLLLPNDSPYQISCQTRAGEIIYRDTQTLQIHNEMPASIISDKVKVANFSPSQACYLGILTGVQRKKINFNIGTPHKRTTKKRPSLKVVN